MLATAHRSPCARNVAFIYFSLFILPEVAPMLGHYRFPIYKIDEEEDDEPEEDDDFDEDWEDEDEE